MYIVRRHVTETAGVLYTAYGTEGLISDNYPTATLQEFLDIYQCKQC
jgi:hypothetical protein